jgi:hypothetical protein
MPQLAAVEQAELELVQALQLQQEPQQAAYAALTVQQVLQGTHA